MIDRITQTVEYFFDSENKVKFLKKTHFNNDDSINLIEYYYHNDDDCYDCYIKLPITFNEMLNNEIELLKRGLS